MTRELQTIEARYENIRAHGLTVHWSRLLADIGYLLGELNKARVKINELKEDTRVLECYDIRRLRKEIENER